jgi:rod shape-determining protein MreC
VRRPSSHALRRLKLAGGLVAASLVLVAAPSRFTTPLRVVFHEMTGPFATVLYGGAGDALATGGSLGDMILGRDRDRALRGELSRLRNENILLAEEVRRLSEGLKSAARLELAAFPFRAVRAPVSGYDLSESRRSIGVRAGTRDGVRPGLLVASRGALVGVVQESGPRHCRVRLITDPGSVVACRLGGDREVCLLLGAGPGRCRVDWLDRESEVEPGAVLVSASLDVGGGSGDGEGTMDTPDGLPAATVVSVGPDRMGPLFLEVWAEPRAALERLEYVEVLVPEE